MNLKRKMLSILPAFTIVLATLLLTPITAKAEATSGDCGKDGAKVNWSYNAGSKTLTISGSGEMADYNTSDNKSPWDDYMTDIQDVVIENGVTSIGSYAFFNDYYYDFYGNFYNYSSLTSVTIGNSVTSIGEKAFYSCNSLNRIEIPSTVTQIGYRALGYVEFKGENLDYDRGVSGFTILGAAHSEAETYAKDNEFTFIDPTCGDDLTWEYNSQNKTLTISGTGAMYDYSSGSPAPWNAYQEEIVSVVIGDEVTSIGMEAFDGCNSLTSVKIPNSVKSVGPGAFYRCEKLSSVTIPDSVEEIGAQAFGYRYAPGRGSVKMSKFKIYGRTGSEAETYAKDNEFAFTAIYTVTVLDDGNGTAYSSLENGYGIQGEEVTLTATPKSGYRFKKWEVVSGGVTVADNKFTIGTQDVEIKAVFEGKCGDNLTWQYDTTTKTLTISGSGAMYDYTNAPWYVNSKDIKKDIETVVIEAGVTSIGEDAFASCYKLKSVTIGNSVTSIGKGAFQCCYGLASVIIPDSVISIGECALGYYEDGGSVKKDEGFIICGRKGSAAETYAIDKGFTFKAIYTVTVSDDGKGTASADPTSGAEGTEVTLTVAPNAGYQFMNWVVVSGGVIVKDNKFTIGTADVQVMALFEKEYSVTVSNDGNGTASANPVSGIAGTEVTLNATPNEGYQFKEWDVVAGDVTVSDDNTFVIGEKDVEVKAIFVENSSASYTITFEAGEGTGIMPSVDKGAGSYTLPANGFTAPAGKEFKAWLVDDVEKNQGDVIDVNGNITIKAIWTEHVHNYGAATYTWAGDNSKVTAKKTCEDDTHVETETVNTTSVETAATCTEKGKTTYRATFTKDGFTEQTKTVENVEALGHDWGEWQVTTPATETAEGVETRTCKNESSHTETHAIAKRGVTSYTITVNSGLGGSASASAGTAEIGVAVSITATPYAGYELDRITYIPADGIETDITEAERFTMPEAAVTVNVTFKEKAVTTPDPATYVVAFAANGGTEVAEQIVQAGDKAAKPADPEKDGYTFAGWYTGEALTEEYDFNTPVTADVTVYAKWIEKTYTVTVSGDGNGTASSDPTSGVAGTVVTLTATPNEGYRFKEWEVVSGDVKVEDIKGNEFTIGNENVVIKAIFEEIPKDTKPDDPTQPDTKDTTKPDDPTNTPNNGGNNGQPSLGGGNNNQTSSNGGNNNQTPSAPATEFKVGDTVKDNKTNTSYIITSTKTNKETVTYVSTTNNTVTSLTVPNTVTVGGKKYKVTEIKANAFKNNKKLKKITIGKNIKKIGKNAFSGCKNLKTVNIKTTKLTKKTVGANAFKNINAKAKVTVPGSKLKAYKTILKARGIKGKKQKIK